MNEGGAFIGCFVSALNIANDKGTDHLLQTLNIYCINCLPFSSMFEYFNSLQGVLGCLKDS